MLSAETSYLLEQYVPEEQMEMMRCFFGFQEELNIEHLQDGFLDLIQQEGDMDREAFVDEMFALTRETTVDILREHGLVFNEQAELSFLVYIVDSLLAIAKYDDGEAILRTLESQYLPEEKFAEVMNLASPYSTEVVLARLESVDPAIFERIEELFQTEHEESSFAAQEMQDTFTEPCIAKVKQYKAMFGEEVNLTAYAYIDTGVVLGMPSKVYLDALFVNHLADKDIETLAKELVILYTLSEDGSKNLLLAFRQTIGQYISDLNTITKLDSEINKLILRYTQYYPPQR